MAAPSFHELPARHPAFYADLVRGRSVAEAEAFYLALIADAVATGVALERVRCVAHAELGVLTKNIDLAIACISSGATIEASRASYLASAPNGFVGRLVAVKTMMQGANQC